jgi:hypothetical protein
MNKFVGSNCHLYCRLVFRLCRKFVKVEVLPAHFMTVQRGGDLELHSFLTSALNGRECLAKDYGRFTSEESAHSKFQLVED